MTFTAALNFSSVDIFPPPTFNERQRVQYFYSPPYLLFRNAVSLFFVYSRDKIAYSLLAVKTLPESLSESVGARLADDDWRLPAVLLQRPTRPLSRIESHRIESNSSSELRKITGEPRLLSLTADHSDHAIAITTIMTRTMTGLY